MSNTHCKNYLMHNMTPPYQYRDEGRVAVTYFLHIAGLELLHENMTPSWCDQAEGCGYEVNFNLQ